MTVIGQVTQGQLHTIVETRDFNADGFIDTLTIEQASGTGASTGVSLATFRDGQTGVTRGGQALGNLLGSTGLSQRTAMINVDFNLDGTQDPYRMTLTPQSALPATGPLYFFNANAFQTFPRVQQGGWNTGWNNWNTGWNNWNQGSNWGNWNTNWNQWGNWNNAWNWNSQWNNWNTGWNWNSQWNNWGGLGSGGNWGWGGWPYV